jgi:hypothetical protein
MAEGGRVTELMRGVGAGPGFQSAVQKNIPRHELLLA